MKNNSLWYNFAFPAETRRATSLHQSVAVDKNDYLSKWISRKVVLFFVTKKPKAE
ncbi:MAG: hypothetical protein FWC39_13365 [Bacteroidetes bacterium]|nr:hypothetical protein [Bacteroidota bacterium]